MATGEFTIKVGPDIHVQAKALAEKDGKSLRVFAGQIIANHIDSLGTGTTQDSPKTELSDDTQWYRDQLTTRDQQIEKLQSALDQSQQLHALSEKRHESKLAQIEGRSFLQRLKAILVANP